jgi:hypothetical protein
MKRYRYVTTSLALLGACCIAADADAIQRKVLGEQFTATWCGPCQDVRQASSMLIDDYPDELVMFQAHVWNDGYDFPWTNARADFYNVSGIPDVWIDGVLNHHGDVGTVQQNYNSMNNLIQQRLALPTDIALAMYAEQVSGPTFNVRLDITVLDPNVPPWNVKVYLLPLLDHYPPGSPYYRNCPMQAAYETSVGVTGGETTTVEHQFTFDSTSWANQSDIRVAAWCTKDLPGPIFVYNAEMMSWPFPAPPNCPADTNGDGVVDVLDLLDVLAVWGATGGPQDINGDGIVNVLDLLEVLGAWGPC